MGDDLLFLTRLFIAVPLGRALHRFRSNQGEQVTRAISPWRDGYTTFFDGLRHGLALDFSTSFADRRKQLGSRSRYP